MPSFMSFSEIMEPPAYKFFYIFRVVITNEKHQKKLAVTVLAQVLWWAPVSRHCRKTTKRKIHLGRKKIIFREETGASIKTIIFSSQEELPCYLSLISRPKKIPFPPSPPPPPPPHLWCHNAMCSAKQGNYLKRNCFIFFSTVWSYLNSLALS